MGNAGGEANTSIRRLAPPKDFPAGLHCAFDCVSIQVNDLDASERFYCNALGLAALHRSSIPNEARILVFQGGFKMRLVACAECNVQRPVHLVLNSHSLDFTAKSLILNGIHWVSAEGEPRTVTTGADGARKLFLRDPDDNLIEITDWGHKATGLSLPDIPEGTFQV